MEKKPHLSPEQDCAANPTENVWVQANAGTGKTSVLTGRLLRILFRSADINHTGILCLTYTNAGAGEMRNRILKSLKKKVLIFILEKVHNKLKLKLLIVLLSKKLKVILLKN